MRASQKWRCSECFLWYYIKKAAQLCCAPEAEQIWVCAECYKSHSFKSDADVCCAPMTDADLFYQ